MVFFRLVFGLALLACVLCFALYALTGNAAWRQRGLTVVKWTLLIGALFFGVLIVQRLIEFF